MSRRAIEPGVVPRPDEENRDLEVVPLEHGLLQSRQAVREVRAVWTIAITFPEAPVQSKFIENQLTSLEDAVQGTVVPGSSFNKRSRYWLEKIRRLRSRLNVIRRRRRGLLPILGDLGKSLFGLATEEDVERLKEEVKINRNYAKTVRHDMVNLVSVINVTRTEMKENRATVNQLINTTGHLIQSFRSYEHWSHSHEEFLQIQSQYYHLHEQVENLREQRQVFLGARRDLETGTLSELLLPLSELQRLAVSDALPQGAEFIRPLLWYYSKIDVRLISSENDLIYAVRLPLVSTRVRSAVTLIAFPMPNLPRNVTLQVELTGAVTIDVMTGQTQDLDLRACSGHDPLVCLPGPTARQTSKHLSCGAALLQGSHAGDYCSLIVRKRTADHLYYHDINEYILVTWGTTLSEQCGRTRVTTLNAGVYLIKWAKGCSLCTTDFCIPGAVVMHSKLPLRRWVPFNVTEPAFGSLPTQRLAGLATPPALSEVRKVNMQELITSMDPPAMWQTEHSSYLTYALIIVGVIVVVLLVRYIPRWKLNKKICYDKSKSFPEEIPMQDLRITTDLTHQEESSGRIPVIEID